MNNKNTILVDCDETVLYGREVTPGCTFFEYEGQKFPVSARPSIKPFLEAVKGRYNIWLVTQGVIYGHELRLKALGLFDYFDNIYGCISNTALNFTVPLVPPNKWLLIDNIPSWDRWNSGVKSMWLGQNGFKEGENYLTCEPYYGLDDPKPLTDLLPKVFEVLG